MLCRAERGIMAGKHKSEMMFTTFLLIFFVQTYSVSTESSFYDFAVVDVNRDRVELKDYIGKVSLVTNVASYCGFTDNHYRDYVTLQREMGPNFQVLAFPCNQFGAQEPEDVATIIESMSEKYSINFPIFSKVEVLGDNVPGAWKYLIEESQTEPNWNFYKYLVDADGRVLGAWGPRIQVSEIRDKIRDAVERADRRARNEL